MKRAPGIPGTRFYEVMYNLARIFHEKLSEK